MFRLLLSILSVFILVYTSMLLVGVSVSILNCLVVSSIFTTMGYVIISIVELTKLGDTDA